MNKSFGLKPSKKMESLLAELKATGKVVDTSKTRSAKARAAMKVWELVIKIFEERSVIYRREAQRLKKLPASRTRDKKIADLLRESSSCSKAVREAKKVTAVLERKQQASK